jgi:hypothetical protein
LLCSGIGVVLAVFNVGRFSQPAVVGNWKSLEDEGGMEFKKDGTGAFHNSPNAPRPPNRGNVPRPDPPATVAFTWRIEAEQEPVLIIESQRQIRFHFHRDGNTLTLTPLQGGNWLRPIVMRKK